MFLVSESFCLRALGPQIAYPALRVSPNSTFCQRGMGPPVTCFHWSRDLSSSARHGPGGASFTLGALASPPSAGGLAHHRTCLRRSPLGYPSAGRIHRAPRYLWSTIPESRSVDASSQKTTLPRALGCQSLSSDPSDVPASPAVAALHSFYLLASLSSVAFCLSICSCVCPCLHSQYSTVDPL